MNGLSSFWSYPGGGTLTKTLTKSIYDFPKSKKPRIARQASKLAQVDWAKDCYFRRPSFLIRYEFALIAISRAMSMSWLVS